MFASLKLLHHPWIRIVLISNLLTQTGIWVRNFAVLLYVVNKTGGDALAVSMISVAEYAPMLVFALIGGVFADRWRPRRTLIWCDALAAVSIWIVLAAMKSGAWEAVFFPTLVSAVLSQLSQPSGMRLFQERAAADLIQPAMSMLQTIFAVFMVLGPVLGTWVYQTFGIGVSMGLTGTV
ncbi:MFS transporter, partial [Paenibacillus sp. AR247]|uniref:MFS transporter n=1 Tax=Paenibacillus sp. AR247 TaxID=1631599 RepID=UPI000D4DC163